MLHRTLECHELFGLLFFGFIIGMRHALEADHLAAVASLTSKGLSSRQAMRHGVAWGLGDTITLFLFGATVLLIGQVIPDQLVTTLELLVGGLLILLGLDLL